MATSTRSANARALPSNSRRDFLAGAGLASLAAAAGAHTALASTADPDATLLALRPEWLRTLAAFEQALDAKSAVDEQILARSGGYPDHSTFLGSADELGAIYRQIADARVAAHAQLGGDAADRLETATSAANTAIVEEIEAREAGTWQGVLFKIEVSENWDHGREELIDSILADVRALATREAANA